MSEIKIKLDFNSIDVVEGDKIYPIPELNDQLTKYLIGEILMNLAEDDEFIDHAFETIKNHGKISLTFAQEAIIEGERK